MVSGSQLQVAKLAQMCPAAPSSAQWRPAVASSAQQEPAMASGNPGQSPGQNTGQHPGQHPDGAPWSTRVKTSDVSSPSLGPPARPSEDNFTRLEPARSPKTKIFRQFNFNFYIENYLHT